MQSQSSLAITCAFVLALLGCKTETSPAPAVSSTSANDAKNPPALASATARDQGTKANEASDEFTEGIQNPALVSSYQTALRESENNPSDANIGLQRIHLMQVIGFERMRMDETDKGYETFIAAGGAAREFIKAHQELPPRAEPVLATIFYNEACAHGRGKNTKQAIVSLDDAFRWGFSDLDTLENDEDLAPVRSQPDFASRMEKWKSDAHARMIEKARSELAAGTPFPFDFSLTDVEGRPIKLSDYKGKTLIVDIWGTWCPPCRAEIPSFVKLQETYGDKGLQIVGLNQEDGEPDEIIKTIKSFMAENGMNYPCAVIDEGTLKQVPNFEGFPTTLFIDRSGTVRMKVVGAHEYAFLESIVLALLDEVPATPGERET